jgi:signal transduction histidine kinase
MRPVEAALLGARALALTAVVARVAGVANASYVLGPVPLTATASGMLLLAFAARHAPKRQVLWVAAALTLAALFALVAIPSRTPSDDLNTPVIVGGLLLVLSVGAGMYLRSRDEERATATRAAVLHAQQVERMALARELHDVVAHHVTGIVVQAQAAQVVAEKSPRATKETLEQIGSSGTEALTAMRRLVASMRDAQPVGAAEDTEAATTNLEADLNSVVARARSAETGSAARIGLTVHLDREVPPEVARSTMRLVQESITNSKKYAVDATCIEVLVTTDGEHLRTRITDDGMGQHAQPAGGSGGYGLVGMRERVELLGGRFNAEPGDHVGWRVEAWLPLGEQAQQGEGA